MAEYIEREALVKRLKKEECDCEWLWAILDIPTADVAPVRHGQWVKEKKDVLIHWHCSACRECYFLEEPNAKYCPHCGARMDGEPDANGNDNKTPET